MTDLKDFLPRSHFTVLASGVKSRVKTVRVSIFFFLRTWQNLMQYRKSIALSSGNGYIVTRFPVGI